MGEISFSGDAEILEGDPTIMWDFEPNGKRSYEIEQAIKESCKRKIKGTPVRKHAEENEFGEFNLDGMRDGLKGEKGEFGGKFSQIQRDIGRGDNDNAIERINDILDDNDLPAGSPLRDRLDALRQKLVSGEGDDND